MIREREKPPQIAGQPILGDTLGRWDADVLRIEGEISPGTCVISKAGIPFKWDKRSGYGYGGAWLQFFGEDLAEFDVTFIVTTEDQRIVWDRDWAKKFRAPKRPMQTSTSFLPLVPSPPALGVYNPILAELGITAIVPKYVSQWTQTVIGKWQKTISFYQWRPPAPALGLPQQPIPDAAKDATPALTAQEIENREKRETAIRLQYKLANGTEPPGKVRRLSP